MKTVEKHCGLCYGLPRCAWSNLSRKISYLRSFSSAKLALVLIITLAVVVAIGTLYESGFNTEIAKLRVYNTVWFTGLLAMFFLNILCAALSRIPFKKHQIGFVIVHIGLMTLLAGAFVTRYWGIDGQLAVSVGASEINVFLPDSVLIVSGKGLYKKIFLKRRLAVADRDDFRTENQELSPLLEIQKFLPFVRSKTSIPNAVQAETIHEVPLLRRSPTPPPALFLKVLGGEKLSLVHNQVSNIHVAGQHYDVYYGRDSLVLPFAIHLKSFEKVDYPGTDRPKSFESHIMINGQDPVTAISMNEPLNLAGYTFYQSSYDLSPGRPPHLRTKCQQRSRPAHQVCGG